MGSLTRTLYTKRSAGIHHTPVRSSTTYISYGKAYAYSACSLEMLIGQAAVTTVLRFALLRSYEVLVRLAIEQQNVRRKDHNNLNDAAKLLIICQTAK